MHPTPDVDVYDENGVDRSLVRWFLSLTPYERLAELDHALRLAELAEASRDSTR
ncbi:MAG: hypothetical protein ACXVEF_00485 [Polyangiales bacterium]